MRKIILVIFLVVLEICAFAQNSKIFFISGGMGILSEVITTPGKLDPQLDLNNNTYYLNYQHLQWNYTSFMLQGRMNILPLGENASISVSATPTVGLGMAYTLFDGGSWYSLGTTIPAFVEFNFGAASRFLSKSDYGFVIGAGYEYNIYPLYAYSVSDTHLTPAEFKKEWKQLAFEFGLRYWNQKNRVNEFNFKLGYGSPGTEFLNFENKKVKEKQSMSFRLSFLRILNY